MTPQQTRAKDELQRMQRILAEWLSTRKMLDEAAAGTRPAKLSPSSVAHIIRAYRDADTENRMAEELRALLSEVYDPAVVPLDRMDAPTLAEVAITGKLPTEAQSAQAQGIIWFAPLMVLAVAGGLGWVLSSSIGGYAEVVKAREQAAACRAGVEAACPYPSWLKWAAIGGVAWLIFGSEVKHWVGLAREKTRRSQSQRYLEK